MSDVLLQWQDESGAWQRGYPVVVDGQYVAWFTDKDTAPCMVRINHRIWKDLKTDSLLVMPLYAKRPVAVWVEIGKLTVVPDRTD